MQTVVQTAMRQTAVQTAAQTVVQTAVQTADDTSIGVAFESGPGGSVWRSLPQVERPCSWVDDI